jgi:hypothetical protein
MTQWLYGDDSRLIWLNDCMMLTPDEYDWIDANGWFRLQIKMTEWLYDANFTWIWLNVCMMPTSDLHDWMTVFCQPRLIWLNDCMMSINMTEWLYEANLDWLYDDTILVSFPVLWYPHDHVILLFLQSYHIISSKHYLDHCGHRRLPTQFCNCKI